MQPSAAPFISTISRKANAMAEYPKEMVSPDGRTVVSYTPTETVTLQARGYTEVDTKSTATKAKSSTAKSEETGP